MLVYIMSRPHSGSTILDILLGNSRVFTGIGQLASDIHEPLNLCACGSRIQDCTFWRSVRARLEAQGHDWHKSSRALAEQAHIRNFLATWRAAADDPELVRLGELSRAVAQAVVEASGKRIMLESSKEPTRGLLLMRYVPEAFLIHLVRDPRSAMASHYWRLKKGYFHFLRRDYPARPWGPLFLILAAISWIAGNLLQELVVRRDPSRVLRIRYEDLRRRPAEEIGRIAVTLGVDLADVVETLARGQALARSHIIGGNEVRLEKDLRFDPEKQSRRPPLPRWVTAMTVLFCWPLMLRYGYLRHDAEPPSSSADASRPQLGTPR